MFNLLPKDENFFEDLDAMGTRKRKLLSSGSHKPHRRGAGLPASCRRLGCPLGMSLSGFVAGRAYRCIVTAFRR
jgi:hypothetical protein